MDFLKYIFLSFVILFFCGCMEHKVSTDAEDIILGVGGEKFKINKMFLYSDQVKSRGRKIKDFAEVDYFSIDFLYPDIAPVPLGWRASMIDKIRISINVSNEWRYDIKALAGSPGMIPLEQEGAFGNSKIIGYRYKAISGEESSGDRNIYIDENYKNYMRCYIDGHEGNPPFPSCTVRFKYLNLGVSLTIPMRLKYRFIEVKKVVIDFLNSSKMKGYN